MDQMELWRGKLARKASRMVFDQAEPATDSPCSWFGRITLGEPDEDWPRSKRRPMWPLLQIVVAELPVRPAALDGIALVRVYIDPKFYKRDTDHGQGWEVRASPTLEGLERIAEPKHGSKIWARRGRWELIEPDYPTSDDLPADFPETMRDDYYDLGCENQYGTKVGGWPSNIQSEIWWAPWNKHPYNPEYVFQIDSDEENVNWMWGDAGVGYSGRGTGEHRDRWAMSWQCH